MENNKIIIKVPAELKKDLSNTKALDGQENESFFQSVDLRDENALKGYFEGYKVLYFELVGRIYKRFGFDKEAKKELKEVKKMIFSLEKIFDEIYGEKSLYYKGGFTLNIESKKDFLDRFYYQINNFKDSEYTKDRVTEFNNNIDFLNYIYLKINNFKLNINNDMILLIIDLIGYKNPYIINFIISFTSEKDKIISELLKPNNKYLFGNISSLTKILNIKKVVKNLKKIENIDINKFKNELTIQFNENKEIDLNILKSVLEEDKELDFLNHFKKSLKLNLIIRRNYDGTNHKLILDIFTLILEKKSGINFIKTIHTNDELKDLINNGEDIIVLEILRIIAEKDINFIKNLYKKEEIKEILNQENIKIINFIIGLLRIIAEKDINFIKNLYKKEEIKERINIDNWYISNPIIRLLEIIGKKDINFIKSFEEEIKKILDSGDLELRNIIIGLLKIIAEKDINFIKNLYKKEEIKERLNREASYISSTIKILKIIGKKDINFIKVFEEEIKKVLDDKDLILIDLTIDILKIIAEKDLDLVMSLCDREKIQKSLTYGTIDTRDSTIELLKTISQKDYNLAKEILEIKSISPQEQEIKEFIQNHNSGSCLVSGYRGVGKTSTIQSCIKEVDKQDNNEKIIKVIVNIPELDKDQKLNKKTMLDRIIIKTYEAVKDKTGIDEFKKDIEDHYRRVYNDIKNSSSITYKSEWNKTDYNWRNIFKLVITLQIGFLFGISIGFLLLYFGGIFINIDNFTNIIDLKNNEKIVSQFKIIFSMISGLASSGLLYKKWKVEEEKKQIIEEIYTPDIAEDKLVKSIEKLQKQNIKIIFVIDELDKLLDFDKLYNGEEKQKIDMKQVFEVLGKLKTLFFETKGALFFIVTNKQAYDYYLLNKHQEDDMISNIFNKVIYIPANSIDNFNLHHNLEISGGDETFRQKRKKYFYFKSHGNWRKAKFEISQMIKGDTIEVDKNKFDFEYKFYDFFDKLYQVFEKGSLDNFTNKSEIFDDFLLSMKGLKGGGYVNILFDKSWDDFINWEKSKEEFIDDNKNILSNKNIDKINNEIIKEVKELKNGINIKYYQVYLSKIKDLIKSNILINFAEKDKDIDLFINVYLDFIQGEFKKETINKMNFFGYFISSIEKISNEYAYRDYVLNYLLNIYENIKFLRKTTLDEILKNIKINKEDLEYPAFTDLMIFWLPLMLIYFHNIETTDEK